MSFAFDQPNEAQRLNDVANELGIAVKTVIDLAEEHDIGIRWKSTRYFSRTEVAHLRRLLRQTKNNE